MSDHSSEISQIQELITSWNHDKDDDWAPNRAVLDTLRELITALDTEDCMYTLSHTRHWCGNPRCRES